MLPISRVWSEPALAPSGAQWLHALWRCRPSVLSAHHRRAEQNRRAACAELVGVAPGMQALRLTPKERQNAGKFSPSFKGPHIVCRVPAYGTTAKLFTPVPGTQSLAHRFRSKSLELPPEAGTLLRQLLRGLSPSRTRRGRCRPVPAPAFFLFFEALSHLACRLCESSLPALASTILPRTVHPLLAHTYRVSRILGGSKFLCLLFIMRPARGRAKAPRTAQGRPATPSQPDCPARPAQPAHPTQPPPTPKPVPRHEACYSRRYFRLVSAYRPQARPRSQGRAWHSNDSRDPLTQGTRVGLKAYRALRGGMWRVLVLGDPLFAVWGTRPEQLRALSRCELDEFPSLEVLRIFWPTPFECRERLWDATYAKELPDVFWSAALGPAVLKRHSYRSRARPCGLSS
ncbi:hypothetical protein Efla_001287 [Eimeria flavescens]